MLPLQERSTFAESLMTHCRDVMRHLLLAAVWLMMWSEHLLAQPRLSGNLQSNANFFVADPKIGATGTPQYDNQKFGAESWLALHYSNWGFDIGLRFDLFNNSNLLNPTGSFTGEGIGRWYIQKEIHGFEVSAGYLYDQIGSGILFRAYEERALMIDNALYGVKAGYRFNDHWKIKAFTGRQKRQFNTYGSVIRGAAVEGFIRPDSTKNFSLAPGMGAVARTYDRETVNRVVSEMSRYRRRDSLRYNAYAFTLFNTLVAGNFTWFVETAYKTRDVIFNEFKQLVTHDTTFLSDGSISSIRHDTITGILLNTDGYMAYTSLAYATGGLGITLEAKYTKNFRFRTDPFQIGVQGQINYLPPLARQNTFRLPARFAPNTQELGEQGYQLDIRYSLSEKATLGLNVSDIYLLDGRSLYREIAPEFSYKKGRKWQLLLGLQFLKYDISTYQFKDDLKEENDIVPWVKQGEQGYVDAFTPYVEVLYRFTPRRSLRLEAQYLLTDDEFGSWAFLLGEVGLAPHWLIFASNMYKVPHANAEQYDPEKVKYDGLHYPSIGIVYTHRANRFSLAYVKQVEGINCAGGICRYEPTFNGLRLQFNSTF